MSICRKLESLSERQLIVRVERRSMTSGAARLIKDFLPVSGKLAKLVGIGRRLERIQKEGQSVKLLVAVSAQARGWREFAVLRGRDPRAITSPHVHSLIQRSVAHEVAGSSMTLQASVI